jgi:hypothetical protein
MRDDGPCTYYRPAVYEGTVGQPLYMQNKEWDLQALAGSWLALIRINDKVLLEEFSRGRHRVSLCNGWWKPNTSEIEICGLY